MSKSLRSVIILNILFYLVTADGYAQSQVKIIGQFTGVPASEFKSVSIKAGFLKKGGETFPISEYGSFSGTIEANESGVCTLTFKDYSYDFVVAHEPLIRMRIDADTKGQLSIYIDDSRENTAYQYVHMLMNGQYRMYSYFAGCSMDSCVSMMQIEEAAYRHNRDSIMRIYPGTYAADVLCRFYDIHAPAQAKQLPLTIKKEFLDQTPWQIDNAYNGKIINKLVKLYLDYAPDTGVALRRSLVALMDKTAAGSVARDHLANVLFEMFISDLQEERIKQFLALANDTPDVFSDIVLKEKCKRYAKVVSGAKAPDIDLPDSTGKELSLQAIAGGHPYTLLVIWNPDCPHCIASMPTLGALYKKYHPMGLEIFAVSLNDDRKEWLKAIKENKCSWINVMVNEKNKAQPEDYFITYTPRIVLINKQGIIVRRQMSPDELESTVSRLF